MATLTFSVDTIAQGNNVGGGLEVSSLPVVDFLNNQGYSDTSDAVFTIEIDDADLFYSDISDPPDGVPEYWIASGTQPVSMFIDADGDGTPEYQVVDQNNNSPLSRDNQSGQDMAKINQNLTAYPVPYDPLNPGTPAGDIGGNLYFATDNDPFTVGEIRAPVDNTISPDNQLTIDANIVDPVVPCFIRGTLIATPSGPRRIETLCEGDLVETVDHGPQPIRWISSRKLRRGDLNAYPELRPIRIPAGALGDGYPSEDLVVSPQHRVVLSSKIIRRMFDTDEVLVAAKMLLGYAGIAVDDSPSVEYFHFLLDRHELVWANGAVSESMLTGPMALKALGAAQLRELASIFPEIILPDHVPTPARRILRRKENDKTLFRHNKNAKRLFSRPESMPPPSTRSLN
ncbi:Hint domain-containing protein [Chachezhania antarctica]|uniref:Hint domain-containing protein n=1 Tax=Chachezhania antarctica TaxID=2340860 RepID=UPI001F09DF04|nr:Hint domain-containing protein [Chachezhania antarctica]